MRSRTRAGTLSILRRIEMIMQAPLTEDRVRLLINEAITAALERHETKMMEHLDSGFGKISDSFAAAFPNGDTHGHRLAHEKAIRDAGGWAKLKAEVIGKFLSAGLWVAAGFMVAAVWQSVMAHIRQQ